MNEKRRSKTEVLFNRGVELFSALCGLVFRAIRLVFGWQGFVFEGNAAKVVIWKIVDGILYVLVQKHPLRKGFQLSGGGVKSDERYCLVDGDLFTQAAWRELFEELKLRTDPKDFVLEAVLQQRVPVGGFFVTGCAGLLSLHFTAEYQARQPQEQWELQKGEVDKVMWIPILDAITRTEKTHPYDFMSLGYRRMLVIFLNRWKQRERGVQPASLYQGRLDRELPFVWDNIKITV